MIVDRGCWLIAGLHFGAEVDDWSYSGQLGQETKLGHAQYLTHTPHPLHLTLYGGREYRSINHAIEFFEKKECAILKKTLEIGSEDP